MTKLTLATTNCYGGDDTQFLEKAHKAINSQNHRISLTNLCTSTLSVYLSKLKKN